MTNTIDVVTEALYAPFLARNDHHNNFNRLTGDDLLRAIERFNFLKLVSGLAALPDRDVPLAVALPCMWDSTESFNRMEMLLAMKKKMGHDEWLTMVGHAWPQCDAIRNHKRQLRWCLGTSGPLVPMMTPEEHFAYVSLPDQLTIYRGCSASHLTGLSWTLNPDVARRFPFLQRYRVTDPVLVTARVHKKYILALKLGRGEDEVITFKARRTAIEHLL